MATTIVDNSEKRNGSARVRVSNGHLVYEEDWEFLVESDTRFEDRNVVLGTPGLPVPLVTGRGSMICQTLSVERREVQPRLWDVKASFSSEVQEGTNPVDPGQPEDPAIWIPVRETKYEILEEIARFDREGKAYLNTAGDPIEVGWTAKRLIPVWEFWQFDQISVTDEILAEQNETYNQAVFKGKQPFTLLLHVGHSSVGFYYGFRRRLTQYFLWYNKKTWGRDVPSQGWKSIENGVKEPILIKGVPHYGNLDEDGAYVPEPGEPYTIKFDEYEPSDFAFLRI